MNAEVNIDIAIVGGGATGCALAIGLANLTACSVTLLDAGKPPQQASSSIFDQRTVALSHSSIQVLSELGICVDAIAQSPIDHIHVSDQNHAGQSRLHASDYPIDAFGYVVALETLGYQIYQDLAACQSEQLTYHSKTSVTNITRHSSGNTLTLQDGSTVNAKLIVLAEGGRTSLAESVGLTRDVSPYYQTAITFTAKTSEPHTGWAYERFTETGPLALLPLPDNHYGIVWTVSDHDAAELTQLSDAAFMRRLQQAFGYRAGVFLSVSARSTYPLALRQLTPAYTQGVVAVGNAAQTLHPIAGQGVNLGFRDVMALIRYVNHTPTNELGRYALLADYQAQHSQDSHGTVALTDSLVRLFSNDHLPLVMGRNVGLSLLNLSAFGKDAFAHNAMGYKHAAF